jgi:hypothetical protein
MIFVPKLFMNILKNTFKKAFLHANILDHNAGTFEDDFEQDLNKVLSQGPVPVMLGYPRRISLQNVLARACERSCKTIFYPDFHPILGTCTRSCNSFATTS